MTKSCRPAELDEGQAKHQSRPVDERAAAAAAGRFIDVPPDLSTPPTGPSPYQGRAPPLLGYSIREFCGAVGISVSYFYELKQAGLAPRTMRLGSRRIISVEEAQKWCRERTEAYYKLRTQGKGPATLDVGRHKTITAEADAAWVQKQAASLSDNHISNDDDGKPVVAPARAGLGRLDAAKNGHGP